MVSFKHNLYGANDGARTTGRFAKGKDASREFVREHHTASTNSIKTLSQPEAFFFCYSKRMAEQILTNEFSICLLPDMTTTTNIQALRAALPASPYRDDIPHITLLRGITAPAESLSNESLVKSVDDVLAISDRLPLTVRVQKVTNASNHLYSLSGGLILQATSELLDLRAAVSNTLLHHGFSIEQEELGPYLPHVTVRLGVPLEGETLEQATRLFPQHSEITFGTWLLLRLVKQDNKRLLQQIIPSNQPHQST
jgi:hypothetical protein